MLHYRCVTSPCLVYQAELLLYIAFSYITAKRRLSIIAFCSYRHFPVSRLLFWNRGCTHQYYIRCTMCSSFSVTLWLMFDHAAAPRPVSGFFMLSCFYWAKLLNVWPVFFFVSPTDPVTGKANFVVAVVFISLNSLHSLFFLSKSQKAHKASDIYIKNANITFFFFALNWTQYSNCIIWIQLSFGKKNSPVMHRIMGDFLFVLLST